MTINIRLAKMGKEIDYMERCFCVMRVRGCNLTRLSFITLRFQHGKGKRPLYTIRLLYCCKKRPAPGKSPGRWLVQFPNTSET